MFELPSEAHPFWLRCWREMDKIVSVGPIVRFSLQPLGCGALYFWLLCELLGIVWSWSLTECGRDLSQNLKFGQANTLNRSEPRPYRLEKMSGMYSQFIWRRFHKREWRLASGLSTLGIDATTLEKLYDHRTIQFTYQHVLSRYTQEILQQLPARPRIWKQCRKRRNERRCS